MKFNKLWLFNTNIVPIEAVVKVEKISLEKAKSIFSMYEDSVESAIGHLGTAEIFSKLMNSKIVVNRILAIPKPLDLVLSLKLNGRIEEGEILTAERMEEIGYEFYLMEFYKKDLLEILMN